MLKLIMIRMSALASLCCASFVVHAMADNSRRVDIPAGSLVPALEALEKQEAVELVYQPDQLKSFRTSGVHGAYAPEDAVRLLLKGTPLQLQTDPSGAMVISTAHALRGPQEPDAASAQEGKSNSSEAFQVAQATSGPSPSYDPVNDQNQTKKGKEERSELQEVVVTGTNIHGVGPGVSEVITLDRQDIERSGVGSTAEALALLPQNFGGGPSPTDFLAPTPGTNLNLTGGAGVDLRGLGPGATLTLINGMRVAPSGFGSFVDVSSIPLTAIDRIEVLPDGASAIYGSDAVAGVVNIILRNNYDGAETRVRYGSVSEGSQQDIRAAQTFGKVWDHGNALLSYEYQDSTALSVTDRAFSGQAEVPGDIIPAARRNSVLASGREHPTNNIEIFGDALVTGRVSSQISTNGGQTGFQNAQTYLYAVSGGIKTVTARDWSFQLDGQWASSRENERQGLIGTAIDGQPTFATRDDLWSVELRADGPVIALPGGNARAAVGTEYRNERFLGTTQSGSGYDDASRHVRAAFTEILVPVVGEKNRIPAVDRFELSAALRYEDYSDVGASTNPKFGVLWQLGPSVKARASWGRSFNAPRLEQSSPYNNFGDIATLGQYGGPFPAPFTNPSGIVLTDGSTSPNLGPERSKNWTAGFEFTPVEIPLFKTGVTYFSYDYTNRIANVAETPLSILQNPSAYSDYTSINPSTSVSNSIISSYLPGSFFNFTGAPFNPATTPVFAILRIGATNLAAEQETGLDISASYARPAFDGQLSVAINGQRLLKFTNEIGTTQTTVNLLNTIYYPANLKLRGTVAWARGGLDLAAAVNYTGSYFDNVDTPQVEIASWTTVDARLAWKFADNERIVLLRKTTLSLSVQNAFNRSPPRVSTANPLNALGYDPTNANPLGRFIAAELRTGW